MHMTYSFLIGGLDKTDSEAELIDRATSLFEGKYYDQKCDENNYYYPQLLVLPDGKLIELEDAGEEYNDLQKLPAGDRWQWCVCGPLVELWDEFRFCGCAGLAGDPPDNTEELIAALCREPAKTLAANYTSAIDWTKEDIGEHKHHHALYLRRQIATIYELFVASLDESHLPPFSIRRVDPYVGYPAIDLRDYGGTSSFDDAAIMMINIHT